MRYDLLIVGGGMAGFAAAITAAERGLTVCVAEAARKPLRKLSRSGNGRGNLFNRSVSAECYHGDPAFAAAVLGTDAPKRAADFWLRAGVSLCEEADGLMYPSSFLASCAADALLTRAEALSVTVRCGLRVTGIARAAAGFHVNAVQTRFAEDGVRKNGKAKPGEAISAENVILEAKNVLLCGGGPASAQAGDATAYALAESLGHHTAELRPALCGLCTETVPARLLQGVRVKAALRLMRGDNAMRESAGEVLFTADGVSGIAVMQLSCEARRGDLLVMDLTRAVCGDGTADAEVWLRERAARMTALPAEKLLTGAAHPALAAELLLRADVTGNRLREPVRQLSADTLRRLANAITSYEWPVAGTRGMDQAQVTAGGLCTDEFDPATLESRLCPGLYAAGEMLDVNGDCGGYNLLFAAIGGIKVGEAIS